MREAVRQNLTVLVHSVNFHGVQQLWSLDPSKLWTITTFGFVATDAVHLTQAWVPWRNVFHMAAGDKHCVDWNRVPIAQFGGVARQDMISQYDRIVPGVRWFSGLISVGGAPSFSKIPARRAERQAPRRSKRLPAGWQVINGGLR